MLDTNNSYLRYLYYKKDKRKKPKIYTWNRYDNLKKFKKKTRGRVVKDRVNECAGPLKSLHYATVITVFVPRRAVRSEAWFKDWIQFVKDLGFYCKYMGESPVRMKGHKMYAVNIYPHMYPKKGRHLLAVHSLIRYGYSYRYRKISYHAMKIHEKIGMDRWKSLYLAHYAQGRSYKGYYGLLPDKRVKKKNEFVFPPDHVGIMEQLCKSKINKSFTNEIYKKMPDIPFKEKNYQKIIDEIGL